MNPTPPPRPFPTDGNESHREMADFGFDMDPDSKNQGQKREKKGECPRCGIKTHKVTRNVIVTLFGRKFGRQKEPLNVPGKVLYGRCLNCNPVEGYKRRRPSDQQPLGVPLTLELDDNTVITEITMDHLGVPLTLELDDNTVITEITMDHKLIQGARELEEEDYDLYGSEPDRPAPLIRGRPEPSDLDTDDRPEPNRRPNRPRPMRPVVDQQQQRTEQLGAESNFSDNMPDRRRVSRTGSHSRMGSWRPAPNRMPTTQEETSQTGSSEKHEREHMPPDGLMRPVDHHDDDRANGWAAQDSQEAKVEIQPPNFALRPPWHNSQKDPRVENTFEADSFGKQNLHNKPFVPALRREISVDLPETTPREPSFKKREGTGNLEVDYSHSSKSLVNPTIPRVDRRDHRYDAFLPYHSDHGPGQQAQQIDRRHPPRADLYGVDPRRNTVNTGFGTDRRQMDAFEMQGHPHRAETRKSAIPVTNLPMVGRNRRLDVDTMDDPVAVRLRPMSRGRASPPHLPAQQVDSSGMHGDHLYQSKVPFAESVASRSTASFDLPKAENVSCIPDIIRSLNEHNPNDDPNGQRVREKAIRVLTELVWKYGENAKSVIAQHTGIKTVVGTMWEGMTEVPLMEAAAQFLLALAASTDASSTSDVIVGEDAEGAVDALLIAMQTHISVENMQIEGCRVLACLASATCNNKSVNDGTLSGGVFTVLNAMDAHRNSFCVQECGIRALHAQCFFSENAESNKRSVIRGDGGGLDHILRVIEGAGNALGPVEWACKLLWYISADEEHASSISASPRALHALLNTTKQYHRKEAAVVLVEAAIGAMANLACLEQNHDEMRDANVIKVVLDAMHFHRHTEGVNVEACSLLANLAVNQANKDAIFRLGGLGAICLAIQSSPQSVDLCEEALRAMACLAIELDDAKAALSSPETLPDILRLCQDHNHSVVAQEMICSLLTSLCVRRPSVENVLACHGVQSISRAMLSHPKDGNLQQVACMAFRNISSLEEQPQKHLRGKPLSLMLQAMSHQKTDAVHLHACCVLWNLAFKSAGNADPILESDSVVTIVKSMQEFMESGPLLEMACGALWGILDSVPSSKKDVVGSGGIDAVTCALVMHPTASMTLEKALGVLSTVSVHGQFADVIASAQGITMVVEAMRNNAKSVTLLELGSLVLRNLILIRPDVAAEAESVIPTLLNAMSDNPDAVDYHREACNALWVMAAQSDVLKSKILALDGVSVLMKSMEHNSNIEDVQSAALGAFHQLSAR